MAMDNGVRIICGSWGLGEGWMEGAKGGEIGTTVIKTIKNPKDVKK